MVFDEGTGKNVAGGIITAFGVMLVLVGLIGSVYLTIYVNSITLGSVFQIGLNGSLPVTGGTLSFLNDTEDSFFTVNASVLSGLKFAASLIPIFVILAVLGGVLLGGRWAYKKYFKKEDRDMGY